MSRRRGSRGNSQGDPQVVWTEGKGGCSWYFIAALWTSLRIGSAGHWENIEREGRSVRGHLVFFQAWPLVEQGMYWWLDTEKSLGGRETRGIWCVGSIGGLDWWRWDMSEELGLLREQGTNVLLSSIPRTYALKVQNFFDLWLHALSLFLW